MHPSLATPYVCPRVRWLMATALGALLGPAALHAQTSQCRAESGATAPHVVELYTSEGCSSCPPADNWLSTLKQRPGVLTLALHVTYWDRLGWPDRFALPEATARQHELATLAGSRQVYTPQVVVNGRDWRIWPKLPDASAAAPVQLKLSRTGENVTAQVAGTIGLGPASRLAGYWAVLEDQHVSKVRAGENAGETLRHDHVVRLYKPVQPWNAAQGYSAQLTVGSGSAEFPRRVVFVVTDANTQRPVQAVALAC